MLLWGPLLIHVTHSLTVAFAYTKCWTGEMQQVCGDFIL